MSSDICRNFSAWRFGLEGARFARSGGFEDAAKTVCSLHREADTSLTIHLFGTCFHDCCFELPAVRGLSLSRFATTTFSALRDRANVVMQSSGTGASEAPLLWGRSTPTAIPLFHCRELLDLIRKRTLRNFNWSPRAALPPPTQSQFQASHTFPRAHGRTAHHPEPRRTC